LKIFFNKLSIGVISSLLLLTGCEDNKAPNPNQLQSSLTLELLDALERSEHDVAVNKFEKLENLDKRNTFLTKFKNIEKTNVVLLNAQVELDAGRPAEALKIVEEGIHLLGPFKNLESAKYNLEEVITVNQLLDDLKHKNKCSADLFKTIKAFRTMGKKSQYAKNFEPVLKKKEIVAQALSVWEAKSAVIDLELDLLGFELQKEGLDRIDIDTLLSMLAELSLENRKISVEKHINYILNKKRKDY
jgi:hypothetical protein